MTWNHRVTVKFEQDGTPYFEVHECFYGRRGAKIPHSWTENAVTPIGDSEKDLHKCCLRMAKAAKQPILVAYIRKNGGVAVKVWNGKAPSSTHREWLKP